MEMKVDIDRCPPGGGAGEEANSLAYQRMIQAEVHRSGGLRVRMHACMSVCVAYLLGKAPRADEVVDRIYCVRV